MSKQIEWYKINIKKMSEVSGEEPLLSVKKTLEIRNQKEARR